MYWYGWVVTVLIVGTYRRYVATMLPASVTRKIPLALVWLLPMLALIPIWPIADAVLDPSLVSTSARFDRRRCHGHG